MFFKPQYCFIYLLFLLPSIQLFGQTYGDHFGTGNDVGVTITSSTLNTDSTAIYTLNGTGYLTDTIGAARFLAQGAFGGSMDDILHLTQIGVDQWIDDQIKMPYTTFSETYDNIYNDIISRMEDFETESSPYVLDVQKWAHYMPYSFYQKIFTEDDILRQKTAFALSQLFVVALQGTGDLLGPRGEAFATYYDLLYEGSFGNFRELLEGITLSPVMGDYLTYLHNAKANVSTNTVPDENFAREIMQLFTIGLHELNNNGTIKLDADQQPIPTYDINDIQEMSKIFTGLYAGGRDTLRYPNQAGDPVFFGMALSQIDYTIPMAMSEEHHEDSMKYLPDGTLVHNASGMEDIKQALDWLFMHDNTPPFIGYRLIQQLVKSNPSPGYINRVALAFIDNGKGERGDLGVVIRAILTDTEARDCEWEDMPNNGKLLQPLERYLNLFKALEMKTPSNIYYFNDGSDNYGEYRYIHQSLLKSPSVFNFFSPFYAESKFVSPQKLVSPEFQIFNSVTSMHYLNRMERIVRATSYYALNPFNNWTRVINPASGIYFKTTLDPEETIELQRIQFYVDQLDDGAISVMDLINELDILICRGQLGAQVKAIIKSGIDENLANIPNSTYTNRDVVEDTLYFIMASPTYAILK